MPAARLSSIQMLRGIAALMVVAHHAITIGHGDMPLRPLFAAMPALDELGCAGVDIFFVLSGFVMAHTLDRRSGIVTAASFWWRRAVRIMPLFWFVSLLLIVVEGITHGTTPSVRSLLNGLTIVPLSDVATFVENPAPLFLSWTLAFELSFYAMIALALRLSPRDPAIMAIGLTLAAATIGLALHPRWSPMAFVANPIVLEFTMGLIAWQFWRHVRLDRAAQTMCMAGAALFAVGLTTDMTPDFDPSPQAVLFGLTGPARLLAWGVPAFLLVLGAAADRVGEPGRLGIGLERVGDASYAIYLVHPLILGVLRDVGVPAMLDGAGAFVIAMVAASVIAGLLLTRYVERPITAWCTARRWPSLVVRPHDVVPANAGNMRC